MLALAIIQTLLIVILIWLMIPSFITNSLILGLLGKFNKESESSIKTI